ncbi:MAG: two-component sensor histidine kinase [Clostridiaceae bacterium]|nr:two-component sensor histidine kinase [Clostridiaceae bacterium]
MNKVKDKDKFKSVRVKLFFSFCIAVTIIILFLIIINNVVLETVYLYAKSKKVETAYEKINSFYTETVKIENIEQDLNKISMKNDFDILILDNKNELLYTSNKNSSYTINKFNKSINDNDKTEFKEEFSQDSKYVYKKDKITIKKILDKKNNINYIFLSSKLDNGNSLYVCTQVESIKESVKISNNLLILIGGISMIVTGIIASFMSKKFTNPILQLNDIAKNMSDLKFDKRYQEKNINDEVNNLGKSINIMADKLESTIRELKNTNIELEKDIEEKSKIDEMRKQFISDVSHELKTPIALIQGYAEGLIENVNTDEKSRKFYAEVILDETNKMDTLVKQLLELSKLEYGKRKFNNVKFNVVELINEIIRKCNVILKENKINVEFDKSKNVYVKADEFYIDQVITNYFTNAIKNAKEVDGNKVIKIAMEKRKDKLRISVFNTGENIKEDDINRIWKRFYKVDTSRNREQGGTGIGLALVKAIMNNYKNDFGVINKKNGVEFYFELDK